MPTTIGLFKNRDERETYSVDLESATDENIDDPGETLVEDADSPTVTILKWDTANGEWLDVSAEFGPPEQITVSGTTVVFDLLPAGAGEQARGRYLCRVYAETSEGRELVETPSLYVSAQGSTT